MHRDEGAFRYALKLLNYRGRSQKELKERLERKGFGAEDIEETIRRLKELGLLNDGALAASLARKASAARHLGEAGALRYISRMGIPRDIALDALSEYDELHAAIKLAEKKMRTMKNGPPEVLKRRLAGCLRRRGHSFDTVRKVIGGIGSPGEEQ